MTMSYLTVYAGNFKRTGRYVQYSEFQYLFIFFIEDSIVYLSFEQQ